MGKDKDSGLCPEPRMRRNPNLGGSGAAPPRPCLFTHRAGGPRDHSSRGFRSVPFISDPRLQSGDFGGVEFREREALLAEIFQ